MLVILHTDVVIDFAVLGDQRNFRATAMEIEFENTFRAGSSVLLILTS